MSKSSENGKIRHFTDLELWKKSHQFIINIYETIYNFPNDERFGLVSQMKRAVVSINANIAEGFNRYHYKDKLLFYYDARGSLAEVQNYLILSKDLGFIKEDQCKYLINSSREIDIILNGLIRTTRSRLKK